MEAYSKLDSKRYHNVILRVIPGHFVTPNSHINYYFDMTTISRRQAEAKAAADAISEYFSIDTIIDTIVCLEGMDVIGAYLADSLTKAGILSANMHKTMYIVSPESHMTGQMIFRESSEYMIRNKNVLVLLASATTGGTLKKAAQTVNYYGGKVVGFATVFSAITSVSGIRVASLFSPKDVPDYRSYTHNECPMCRNGRKVDAICNGYGFSRL
ncbi:MAG: phosphoribosyltransferase [Lachnospiraceae bacterium]|nr:phosphoribosyltransferase [Lachnospiraceae bacterium]